MKGKKNTTMKDIERRRHDKIVIKKKDLKRQTDKQPKKKAATNKQALKHTDRTREKEGE